MPFQEVTFEWQGKEYVLPPKKILRTIAAVEEVITLREIGADAAAGKARLAKLAMAHAIALRAAGADVSDDDCYAGMFGGAGTVEASAGAVQGLLALMLPPSAFKAAAETKESPQGNEGPTAD